MFFYFYFIIKFHTIVATGLLQVDLVMCMSFFVCLSYLVGVFLTFLTSEVSFDTHKSVEVVRSPPPIFSIFSLRKTLTETLLKKRPR